MTRKEFVNESLKVVNAVEVNGVFELTNTQLLELGVELGNSDQSYTFCNNKKDETLKAIYDTSKKNKFAVLRIIPEPKKEVKVGTEKKRRGCRVKGGSKGNNQFYLVVMKKKESEKEEKITGMNTCTEIKLFLKGVSKKELEYLKIYSDGVEVRKSAWVG